MNDVSSQIEKLKEGCILAHTGSPYHSPLINGEVDRLAVETEYGEMLMNAVVLNKPKEIVEIGTASGYSASWMGLGLLQAGRGKITTFDCVDRHPIFRYAPESIDYKVGKDFLDSLDCLPKKIDFVFHDAQHRYELITADLDAVMPRMAKDAQVWVHDVRGSELPNMMKEYFNERGYEFTHFPTGNGMGKATRGGIQ